MFKTYTESINHLVELSAPMVVFSFDSCALDQEIPVYDDLTVLSSDDLGRYSSLLRGFSTYLTHQYIEAFAAKEFFEAELERAEAEAIMEFTAENPKATATAIKNCAVTSQNFAAAKNQLTGAKVKIESIAQYRQAIEAIIATVSREISRRIGLHGRNDENY